jgi:hypothetical protein
VDEFPATPLLVVRAGRDSFAGVNESIDAFARLALASNLPLTIVNHHAGVHAFDLEEDSPTTRRIAAHALAFLQGHL